MKKLILFLLFLPSLIQAQHTETFYFSGTPIDSIVMYLNVDADTLNRDQLVEIELWYKLAIGSWVERKLEGESTTYTDSTTTGPNRPDDSIEIWPPPNSKIFGVKYPKNEGFCSGINTLDGMIDAIENDGNIPFNISYLIYNGFTFGLNDMELLKLNDPFTETVEKLERQGKKNITLRDYWPDFYYKYKQKVWNNDGKLLGEVLVKLNEKGNFFTVLYAVTWEE